MSTHTLTVYLARAQMHHVQRRLGKPGGCGGGSELLKRLERPGTLSAGFLILACMIVVLLGWLKGGATSWTRQPLYL